MIFETASYNVEIVATLWSLQKHFDFLIIWYIFTWNNCPITKFIDMTIPRTIKIYLINEVYRYHIFSQLNLSMLVCLTDFFSFAFIDIILMFHWDRKYRYFVKFYIQLAVSPFAFSSFKVEDEYGHNFNVSYFVKFYIQ